MAGAELGTVKVGSRRCFGPAGITRRRSALVRRFGGTGRTGEVLARTTHKLKTQIVTGLAKEQHRSRLQWPLAFSNRGASPRGNYQPHRTGLGEGDDFNLCLDFQSSTDPSDIKQIRHALEAWSLFGGLGSRVRRGMGSVTLMTMDGMEQLLTQDEYEKRAAEFLGEFSVVAIPPYTAFSSDAHFRLLESGNKARQVLDHAGQAYKNSADKKAACAEPSKYLSAFRSKGWTRRTDVRARCSFMSML